MSTEEIQKIYALWKDAVIKGDIQLLDKMYADNFSWTNIIGTTNNKAENLYKVSSGNLRYTSWVNKDISIDIAEDLA